MNARWFGAASFAIYLVGCGAAANRADSSTLSKAHACSSVSDLESQVAAVYAAAAVFKVEPLYTRPGVYDEARFPVRAYAHRPLHHVEGATLHIAAPAATSPAYIERALSCYAGGAGNAQAIGSDPLRVASVKDVDVRAAGPALRVEIRAHDRAGGDRVLEAALNLRSSVGITQLAAGRDPSAF